MTATCRVTEHRADTDVVVGQSTYGRGTFAECQGSPWAFRKDKNIVLLLLFELVAGCQKSGEDRKVGGTHAPTAAISAHQFHLMSPPRIMGPVPCTDSRKTMAEGVELLPHHTLPNWEIRTSPRVKWPWRADSARDGAVTNI